MADSNEVDEKVLIWEKRAILMSAFGLVGFGALVGVMAVYFHYIKRRLSTKLSIKSYVRFQPKQSQASSKIFQDAGSDDDSIGRPGRGTSHHSDDHRNRENSNASRFKGDDVSADENVTSFFTKVDQQMDGNATDQHEAYNMLRSNRDKLQHLCGYWWRMARATHIEAQIAEQRQDQESQKSLLISAVSDAEKALNLNDESADSHKWFAITTGSRGDFLKIKERIQSGYVFKEHIDRAIELNPNDASLHHLLGRFCYEVSQLSWAERRIAATLFSDPPTATIGEALSHFLECDKLGKPSMENHLYIAKCYVVTSDTGKAAQFLHSASKIPVVTAEDKKAHALVMTMLPKYRKYL